MKTVIRRALPGMMLAGLLSAGLYAAMIGPHGPDKPVERAPKPTQTASHRWSQPATEDEKREHLKDQLTDGPEADRENMPACQRYAVTDYRWRPCAEDEG